jgi:hypothetical protein
MYTLRNLGSHLLLAGVARGVGSAESGSDARIQINDRDRANGTESGLYARSHFTKIRF